MAEIAGITANATAVTANTIVIDNRTNFENSGLVLLGGNQYRYTGLTAGGGTIGTLTGVTPDPSGETVPGTLTYRVPLGGTFLPFRTGRIYAPADLEGALDGSRDVRFAGDTVGSNLVFSVETYGQDTGGLSSGSIELENATIDLNPRFNARNIGNQTWTNVDVVSVTTEYRAVGNWAGTNRSFIFNNVNWATDIDEDLALANIHFFFSAATGTFNNVSYWNNIDLGLGAAGSVPGLPGTSNHANTVFGPFGIRLNGPTVPDTATHSCLFRMANQGRGGVNVASTDSQSWCYNFDMRAWGQLDQSTRNFYIDHDSGGSMLLLNPLWGRPQNFVSFQFVNIFGTLTNRTRQAVVTNPVCTDSDVRYALPGGTTANSRAAVAFLVPTTFANDSALAHGFFTGNSQIIDGPPNGFGFIVQDVSLDGQNNSYANAVTNGTDITSLPTDLSFRQYSWLQTPTNVLFGRTLTVAVAPDNATEQEIATARAGGFNTLVEGGFSDEWVVNTDLDLITNQTEIDSITKANTVLNTLGGVDTGSYLVAGAKFRSYSDITNANIAAANTKIDLDYTVTASEVAFDGDLTLRSDAAADLAASAVYVVGDIVSFSNTEYVVIDDFTSAATINQAAVTALIGAGDIEEGSIGKTVDAEYNLPIGDLPADDFISSVTAPNITISGDGLDTTTSKVDLDADTLINVGGDIDTIILTAPSITLGGDANAVTANGNTTLHTDASSYTGVTVNGNLLNRRSDHVISNLTLQGTTRSITAVGYAQTGQIELSAIIGTTGFSADGPVEITSATTLNLNVPQAQASNFTAGGSVVITVVGDPQTLRVTHPTDRGGTWAVIDASDNSYVGISAPVRYTAGTTANFIDVSDSESRNLVIYWKADSDSSNAYNTTVFTVTGSDVTASGTTTVTHTEVADVLWSDVVSGITTTATATIVDGNSDFNSVDRFEITYVDTGVQLNDLGSGAARTLLITMIATNDVDYMDRMASNGLTSDIIVPGVNEVQVDSRYCYLNSSATNIQVQVTSITDSAGDAGTSITPISLSGVTGSTIVIIPTVAGATPGQIAAGVSSGVNTASSVIDIANRARFLTDGRKVGPYWSPDNSEFSSGTTYPIN